MEMGLSFAFEKERAWLRNLLHEFVHIPQPIVYKESPLSCQVLSTQIDSDFSAQLLYSINHHVELHQLGMDKIVVQHTDFSLQELIQDTHQQFVSFANAKNIQLNIQMSPTVEPVLIGDADLMHYALMNIMSDALVNTEKGSVSIMVDVLKDTHSYQFIRIKVADTSIGMSVEKINHLMRNDSEDIQYSTSRELNNLSVLQSCIHLMGGKLEVRSVEGEGTVFSVFIEWRKGNSNHLKLQDGNTVKNIFQGKTVLLVEDNDMNRFVATQSLLYAGCKVHEAINGQEAIEALRKHTYHAILMDIQMPLMDGIEATQYIRNIMQLTTPIIAHTANTFNKDVDLYLLHGMNDCISKPYDEQMFYQKLAPFLS